MWRNGLWEGVETAETATAASETGAAERAEGWSGTGRVGWGRGRCCVHRDAWRVEEVGDSDFLRGNETVDGG